MSATLKKAASKVCGNAELLLDMMLQLKHTMC